MIFSISPLFLTFLLYGTIYCDTPANCSYAEIQGTWLFYETARGHDNSINCSLKQDYVGKKTYKLNFPNLAVDEFGNAGTWTLIYNQGFEIIINGRKLFAFSKYDNQTSYCYATEVGWAHNVNGGDWSCINGLKSDPAPTDKRTIIYKRRVVKELHNEKQTLYQRNEDFINQLNQVQTSWEATHYPQFSALTLEGMFKMAGGKRSKIAGIPVPNKSLDEEARSDMRSLPDSFDWRNVGGVNYLSPVRNQGGCGSCFAFASMGMNEARLRVMTNNTVQVVLSPQDVVECCPYSQGCEGGFPYLVGGKYAADFGLVSEDCNPYVGTDRTCTTKPSCPRQYAFNYRYVGGYYGACNEEYMKLALRNGPIVVAFEVYNDFFSYKGGVYHHVEGLEDKFNPFEITNHAVLLVGYGTDPSAGPYWIVKNSWGTGWGEQGFFRIRRGVDECSIESIAVESFPVL